VPRRLDSPFVLGRGLGPHEVASRDLNALVDRDSMDGARLVETAQAFFARRDAGVLLVLQSVNAGGKDGAIAALQDTLGPEALTEHKFRRPAEPQTLDELLTETARKLPSPGELVIFNRS
jgi:polyphosphate kinase 2 (PPK2 family)